MFKKRKSGQTYRGWSITYDRYRPATGLWVADRFGVSMCAGTPDLLARMVDSRIQQYPPNGD